MGDLTHKSQVDPMARGSNVNRRQQLSTLAMVCETQLEASALTGKDIPDLLAQDAALKAAWDRGQFLRKVRLLAHSSSTLHEIARHIGMTGMELRSRLDCDPEAKAIYDSARLAVFAASREAIIRRVLQGDPAALRIMAAFFHDYLTPTMTQPTTVGPQELAALLGSSRQSVWNWTQAGLLHQNSLGGYELKDVIMFLAKKHRQLKAKGHSDPSKEDSHP